MDITQHKEYLTFLQSLGEGNNRPAPPKESDYEIRNAPLAIAGVGTIGTIFIYVLIAIAIGILLFSQHKKGGKKKRDATTYGFEGGGEPVELGGAIPLIYGRRGSAYNPTGGVRTQGLLVNAHTYTKKGKSYLNQVYCLGLGTLGSIDGESTLINGSEFYLFNNNGTYIYFAPGNDNQNPMLDRDGEAICPHYSVVIAPDVASTVSTHAKTYKATNLSDTNQESSYYSTTVGCHSIGNASGLSRTYNTADIYKNCALNQLYSAQDNPTPVSTLRKYPNYSWSTGGLLAQSLTGAGSFVDFKVSDIHSFKLGLFPASSVGVGLPSLSNLIAGLSVGAFLLRNYPPQAAVIEPSCALSNYSAAESINPGGGGYPDGDILFSAGGDSWQSTGVVITYPFLGRLEITGDNRIAVKIKTATMLEYNVIYTSQPISTNSFPLSAAAYIPVPQGSIDYINVFSTTSSETTGIGSIEHGSSTSTIKFKRDKNADTSERVQDKFTTSEFYQAYDDDDNKVFCEFVVVDKSISEDEITVTPKLITSGGGKICSVNRAKHASTKRVTRLEFNLLITLFSRPKPLKDELGGKKKIN